MNMKSILFTCFLVSGLFLMQPGQAQVNVGVNTTTKVVAHATHPAVNEVVRHSLTQSTRMSRTALRNTRHGIKAGTRAGLKASRSVKGNARDKAALRVAGKEQTRGKLTPSSPSSQKMRTEGSASNKRNQGNSIHSGTKASGSNHSSLKLTGKSGSRLKMHPKNYPSHGQAEHSRISTKMKAHAQAKTGLHAGKGKIGATGNVKARQKGQLTIQHSK